MVGLKKKVRILMVDDHPPILEGYQSLIGNRNVSCDFEFFKAYSSDQSIQAIISNKKYPFHVVFLEINLPPSEKYGFINGEELGLKIRKISDSRIIVLTSLNDSERILSILNNLRPEGFITKTEITRDVLLAAIDSVLSGRMYLSDKILKVKSSMNFVENNCLDRFDLKIIYFLSKGEKMKNMPAHLPLSMSSIERRKRKIKIYFGVEDASDLELLALAKKKGFI